VTAEFNAFPVSELAGGKVSFKPRQIYLQEKYLSNRMLDIRYMQITMAMDDICVLDVTLFILRNQ